MGKVTLTDEGGTPATPVDGATLFAVAGELRYVDDSGAVHTLGDGGAYVSAAQLKAWTEGEAYELTAITYDSDGVVTTATVKWPDGSAGVFTTTTKNTTWLAVDAYTISHTASLKTVTQTAVTRSGTTGQVTAKPALTVAP